MKNKLINLFIVLLLVSCGSDKSGSLSSDAPKGVSSSQVTAQSILSRMEKGRYVQGELLVKFKSGKAASSLKTHQAVGAKTIRSFTVVPDLEHVKLPEGLSVKDAIVRYMSDPNVEYAEPNYMISGLSMPPDDEFFNPQQWALNNTGYAGGTPGDDIKALPAWDITQGNGDIVITELDSGIDYNHLDFKGSGGTNIWTNPGETNCADDIDDDGNGFVDDCKGWDFTTCAEFDLNTFECLAPKPEGNDPIDDYGHGTHVSGIIGAKGDNHIGIAGVMWNVQLMSLKVLNSQGIGTFGDVIAAIDYIVTMRNKGINIKVVNSSMGGQLPPCSIGTEDLCLVKDAFASLNTAGILLVAAAGNTPIPGLLPGTDNEFAPIFPASFGDAKYGGLPNIISVAATDQNDNLAFFSNSGFTSVHVAAPGVYILSTVPFTGVDFSFTSLCTGSFDVGYDFCSGTSMAAPHVAGLAGLLYSVYPDFNYLQIRGMILKYVDFLPNLDGFVFSNGRINAFKAVSALLPPANLSVTTISPTEITLTWTDNTGEEKYILEKQQADGSFVKIADVAQDNISFTDSGLSPETTYTYRLKAFSTLPNPPGASTVTAESTYSQTSATTPATPPPSSGGGGGGCSIGGRQNTQTTAVDFALLALPLIAIALMRRRR